MKRWIFEIKFLIPDVDDPEGHRSGSRGAGGRESSHLYLAVVRTTLSKPVSSEGCFFDSMKGGESNLAKRGCQLRQPHNLYVMLGQMMSTNNTLGDFDPRNKSRFVPRGIKKYSFIIRTLPT